MTEKERTFWNRYRGLLIEQEKALTEQRAVIIGQRKAIESLLGSGELEAHEPDENTTSTTRPTYST